MQRPVRGDCEDDYFLYIDQVPDGDVLTALEIEIERTCGELSTLDEERALHRYEPGKWTVKEVVGHLLDAERTFGYRALCHARQDPAALPGFDQDPWVVNSHVNDRPLPRILDELRLVRLSHLAMFRSFSAEDWTRQGMASGFQFKVNCFPWILAGHELHHRKVLAEKYGVL